MAASRPRRRRSSPGPARMCWSQAPRCSGAAPRPIATTSPRSAALPKRRAGTGRDGADRPMIPRYSRPEMVAIWSPETRFRIWFEIEAHATTALAELGVVPREAAATIWEKGSKAVFDTGRIDEIEREVKHDVIAFLTHLSEFVGPEARFGHHGMTSSDLLHTCFNAQLVRASNLVPAGPDGLPPADPRRPFEHKTAPAIGRSHRIHAGPTTFGLKLAQAYAEFARAKLRLIEAQR